MTAPFRNFCLFFLLLLAGSGLRPALAQRGTSGILLDTTIVLPDVTVTAARVEMPTRSAPVRVTVLDAAHSVEAGVRSVADLLETHSGAFIRRYGAGGLATLSLRGTGAGQTLILLDGHRIADPQLGQLDLSLLPTLLLQSVEVMHGAGSSLYGTDGLGGVVNLRTHAPGAAMRVLFTGGAGAFGERRGGLLASGGRKRLSALALVEHEQVEGDYLYLNKALFPPREVPRDGADRRGLSIFAGLRYHGDRQQAQVSGWHTGAERGLPTIGSTRQRGERQWDRQSRLWADYETRFSWGALRLGGLYQQSALRYASEQLRLDQTGRTQIGSVEMEVRTTRVRRWLLASGLAAGYGRARHPSLRKDAVQANMGLFLHGTGEYGRLLLFPALRADAYFLSDTSALAAISPRFGLNVRPVSRLPLHLKASAGRAFRMPTFNDRFWQPGGRPDLRPEHGWTYDAGLMYGAPSLQTELSVFAADVRDQITWMPTKSGIWSPENATRVRSRGLETSLQAQKEVWSWLRLKTGFFYTLTDTRDRSNPASPSYNRQVRYVPRHQFKLFGDFQSGPLTLGATGRYVGARPVSTDGSDNLDPFFLLDLQARFHVEWTNMSGALAVLVDNVFDRTYVVLQNYPMPPRHARLQLTLTFH